MEEKADVTHPAEGLLLALVAIAMTDTDIKPEELWYMHTIAKKYFEDHRKAVKSALLCWEEIGEKLSIEKSLSVIQTREMREILCVLAVELICVDGQAHDDEKDLLNSIMNQCENSKGGNFTKKFQNSINDVLTTKSSKFNSKPNWWSE